MIKSLRYAMLSMLGLLMVTSLSAQTLRLYKKVTVIESGKAYAIVAESDGALKAATAITSNYGYLKVDNATASDEGILLESQANEFVFEATEGGYTIKQNDGRYLYQTGTYNSFNVNAEPTEGQVWTAVAQDDGTFVLTNVLKNKYVQYSPSYTSFGCYASAQSGAVMPTLYEFVKEVEGTIEVTKAADIKAFGEIAEGTTVELTLKDAQVVYVNEYNGTKELFVRDASGAADLYDLGINATAGQVLNGTIKGKRGARSGFTVALMKSDASDATTVTVGNAKAVEPVEVAIDEATTAFVCDLVTVKDVTISGGKANADGVQLPLYDRFQLGIISQLKEDESHYNLVGLMYDGGTTYGAELVVVSATYADGSPLVEEAPTAVASIEALLALESPSTNLELTLTNAQVLFNDNNSIYMRENGKAVCFYQMPDTLKKMFATNAIINGKVNIDYEVYRLLPEAKKNVKTSADNLTATEGEAAVPVETTLAEVATGKNVCDLVTLEAKLVRETSESGSNTYYLQQDDVKLVVVNNGKNLKKLADEGVETIRVTGVVNTGSDKYQVKLTQTAVDVNAQGISTISTDAQKNSVYNLQGQRVVAPVKGLYILNGKKVVLK